MKLEWIERLNGWSAASADGWWTVRKVHSKWRLYHAGKLAGINLDPDHLKQIAQEAEDWFNVSEGKEHIQ